MTQSNAVKPFSALWLPVALAILAIIPAAVLRFAGWHPAPIAALAVFGAAILAAGFLMSWGAEAAESAFSQGLILAIVALVTVLPEYAIDMVYAYKAGSAPEGGYVAFAAANMTGANRLLIGLVWPGMVLLHWWKTRDRVIDLMPANAIEIAALAVSSAYAFVIVWKNRIDVLDTAVLLAIFGIYLWRVSRLPNEAEDDDDDAEEPGPGGVIAAMPRKRRLWTIALLAVAAAAAIIAVAEPFAEALVVGGRALGIDQFLLIQWVGPLASESPEVVIGVLFVLAGRAGAALIAMISDKINQWTLLVGMLPLAMSVGAGHLVSLPLDARQHEEFFLTAAQSLLGLALLLRLRLSLPGALALLALFLGQFGLAFALRGDGVREVAALTWVAWAYLALATAVFASNLGRLRSLAQTVLSIEGKLEG